MDKVVQAKREDARGSALRSRAEEPRASTRERNEDASSPAFEEILTRLSTVVERLESGELPLEESLALFEEGIHLSRNGAARLDEAERRVERLLHDDGTTAPFVEPRAELRIKENEVP
jgi:exodeoxyribonuclease VII small subunit